MSRPGTPSATPMLTVRVSISPSMATRSHSVDCSRYASASAVSASMGAAGTTTNSSPPSRAIRFGPLGTFAQPFGEDPDEPVAGGMAEIVVDRLQPVEVEEQRRYGPRLARGESRVEVRQQRAAIVQSGQVVVFGKVAKLLFGAHARLHLREQRSDRLECVEFLGQPVPVAELDEAQHSGGDVAGHQRHAGHRGGRYRAGSPRCGVGSRRWPVPDGTPWVPSMLGERENRIGVGEVDDGERVRVRDSGRTGHSATSTRGADAVIVVAEEADVDIEVLDEVRQHLADSPRPRWPR